MRSGPHHSFARVPSAFTLIELLVVVGIITLLAALLFPVASSFKESGNRSACLAHMRQVGSMVLQFSADNGNKVLPAVSGANAWMNDNLWYEMLDAEDVLVANPRKGETWSGKKNGVMSCPSRDSAPFSYWMGGKHALHYSMNQHPGFFNRVNTSSGGWPTLASVTKPSRTFMLAESSFPVAYANGDYLVYPHARKGGKEEDGEGMNLVFYDGHGEYYKGRLPKLWVGDYGQVPYDTIAPEDSFPWY